MISNSTIVSCHNKKRQHFPRFAVNRGFLLAITRSLHYPSVKHLICPTTYNQSQFLSVDSLKLVVAASRTYRLSKILNKKLAMTLTKIFQCLTSLTAQTTLSYRPHQIEVCSCIAISLNPCLSVTSFSCWRSVYQQGYILMRQPQVHFVFETINAESFFLSDFFNTSRILSFAKILF